MKSTVLFILFFIFSLSLASAQAKKGKKDLVGKWIFEAPLAPEGYTSGIIEVGLAEKKYSTTMMFTGNEEKLSGDKVKFEKDTLKFNVYIGDENVSVKLKFDDKTKMSGKAVYSEGEVPLTLTRETKKK
jgi:S-adenosylmethionine:tRNA-ribosyltransferase-isomerase (queuine synthetase)